MEKIKLRTAFAALNNRSIIIYYSYKGERMKFPTGISITGEKDRYMNHEDWDAKNQMLKIPAKYSDNIGMKKDFNSKIKKIKDLVLKANNYISEYFNKNINILPSELEKLMLDEHEQIISIAGKSLMEYYEDFRQKKIKHFAIKTGKPISIKDYNSTKNLLLAFQAFKKKVIRVDDVVQFWLEDFHEFCKIEHPEKYGDYKVIIKGDMKNGTIKKRFSVLAEFYDYLKELGVSNQTKVDMIRKYRKGIDAEKIHKETLTIKEIHLLYKTDFNNKSYELIRDLFVFLCFTGIRFQDLIDFNKEFIKSTSNGFVYIKKASKTSIAYNIPLAKIVIEILKKYDYTLPKITNQYGNRIIKEALKITGLFNDAVEITDKKTGKYFKRYEVITLHKARNTFITNLVETVPLNELMKYTGHKKLSTLQSYIDVNRPVSNKYISVFDIKEAKPRTIYLV